MKTIDLKVARIGNSRGVRLPADTLRRYRIGAVVTMEERTDGLLLRPPGPATEKLTWADTAREMAAESEAWSEWNATAADGLTEIPWETGKTNRAAEKKARYSIKPSKGSPL